MANNPHDIVILVVEDEPFIRMVAADVLAEQGRTVLEADCAEGALAVIEAEGRVDLLFTDINMPGDLDGLELAALAHDRQPDLKLIVTSGAQKMSEDDIPDHGTFIPKPYSSQDLTRLVAAKLMAAQ